EKEELNNIKILINQDNGLKEIIRNINSNFSKEKIIEYIKVNLDYYSLTRIAIKTLADDPRFLTSLFFKKNIENIENEFFSVIYGIKNYYIIESGKGFYSVILRRKDGSQISREDLIFIYEKSLYKYKLNWSFIKLKNIFDEFDLVILTPNKHKISIDNELNVDIAKTILNIKNKFKKKIEDDSI